MTALIELHGAEKVYGDVVKTLALAPTDVSVKAGELVVILGPSGSGKTTLLNLIGGLDTPSGGAVHVADHDLAKSGGEELTRFRRDNVGFIFQFFNLVPTLTAAENVALAAELAGKRGVDVTPLLAAVGLGEKADRFPEELSGGEQQRVAIARALAKKPRVLLADEPTGALDHETGAQIVKLLRGIADDGTCAVIVVTHDESLTSVADRVIRIRDGHIVSNQGHEAGAAGGSAP